MDFINQATIQLKQDFEICKDMISKWNNDEKIHLTKQVGAAALRILGASLAAAAVTVFIATPIIAAVQTVLFVASAVVLVVLLHDLIIMYKNSQEHPLKQAYNIIHTELNNILNDSEIPQHPMSKGTLVRPLWDWVLSEMKN